MSNLCAMKEEIAMSFAAGEVGQATPIVRRVVDEYLEGLVRCPVCDGEGLHAGAECRFCQTLPDGRHVDPEYVAWFAACGESRQQCRDSNDPMHAECGFRLVLPMPETTD